MHAPPKHIVLCADDYGLAPGINRGILELLNAGRLSATSAITTDPSWLAAGVELRPFTKHVDVGLHLILTDQTPLGALPTLAPNGRLPSRPELERQALDGRLHRAEILDELDRQFDAFEAAVGRPPDHVDGHHHVHQLPGLAPLVIEVTLRRAPRAYVRTCWAPAAVVRRRGLQLPKALALAQQGAGLRRRLRAKGLATHKGFSGIYDFLGQTDYAEAFGRFLIGLGDGGLVMCHPGYVDDILRSRDPLTDQRQRELEFLASDAFPSLLARHNFRLARRGQKAPGVGSS